MNGMKKVIDPRDLLRQVGDEGYVHRSQILIFEESVMQSMTPEKAINCVINNFRASEQMLSKVKEFGLKGWDAVLIATTLESFEQWYFIPCSRQHLIDWGIVSNELLPYLKRVPSDHIAIVPHVNSIAQIIAISGMTVDMNLKESRYPTSKDDHIFSDPLKVKKISSSNIINPDDDFDILIVVPPKNKTRKKYSKNKAKKRRKLASASRKKNR